MPDRRRASSVLILGIVKTELHARHTQNDVELRNKCRLELLGALAWHVKPCKLKSSPLNRSDCLTVRL